MTAPQLRFDLLPYPISHCSSPRVEAIPGSGPGGLWAIYMSRQYMPWRVSDPGSWSEISKLHLEAYNVWKAARSVEGYST